MISLTSAQSYNYRSTKLKNHTLRVKQIEFNPAFNFDDGQKYFMMHESLDGKIYVKVPYSKEALSPVIDSVVL